MRTAIRILMMLLMCSGASAAVKYVGSFWGDAANMTNSVQATNLDQLITLGQLQDAIPNNEVLFLTTNLATGFNISGGTRTNWASQTLPSDYQEYTISGVSAGDYVGMFISTNVFTQVGGGLLDVSVFANYSAGASASILAECYVVNATNGIAEYEFMPASSSQPLTLTKAKYTFSVPITDYISTTNFHIMTRFKVGTATGTPNITIYAGSTNNSHFSFDSPGDGTTSVTITNTTDSAGVVSGGIDSFGIGTNLSSVSATFTNNTGLPGVVVGSGVGTNTLILNGITNLTDAASIAVDAASARTFRVTLGGDRTMANPVNPVDGQILEFEITQDGTGSRTIAWDTKYAGSDDLPLSITLSTTPAKMDMIRFKYNSSADKYYLRGYIRGF